MSPIKTIRNILCTVTLMCSGCSENPREFNNGFEMNLRGEKTIKNPSIRDIKEAIDSLRCDREDEFLILGKTDLTYIQAIGCQANGFEFEFQDGDIKSHYRSKTEITSELLQKIFYEYIKDSSNWKSWIDLERIEVN